MTKKFAHKLLVIFLIPVSVYSTTKENFIQNLQRWEIPEDLSHPRLYHDADTIEKLHRRYQDGCPQIRSFLSQCDSIIALPLPDYSDYNASRYKARDASQRLSFAYILTRDIKYAAYARKIIGQLVDWKDWVYQEHKPRRVDLGVAGVAYILALCYDWLYPELTNTERSDIENAILKQGLLPFYEVYSAKSEGWTRVGHNWRSVICGEMGIATLVLLDKVSDWKQILNFAIDGVVDVLNQGGKDGGWNEGVSYWGYGIGQALMFIEALNRVSKGKIDLYELPFLKVTGNFGLYTRTPGGSSFNFSDCNPGPPKSWLMALLAAHFQNPYWQWSAQKDPGNTIPDILFYDPGLQAVKPLQLPLAKHFEGIQIATIRSSWEDNAIFIGLKAGQSMANHSHLDLNSFILHAYGKALLIDQHSWPYAHYLGFFDQENRRWDFEANHTIAHNTLLVDGQGQRYGETYQGHIINFSISPEITFAVAEADSAYGSLINKFHRYLALVENRYVVIIDDIKVPEIRKLEWLMHYAGDSNEDSSGVFHIANDQAYLDILFLRPAKQDNRVISFENHQTSYQATRQLTKQTNRFISVRPLHRKKSYRFITLAFPYLDNTRPAYAANILTESDNCLKLMVTFNASRYTLEYNFSSATISLSN